ncbi:MAG: metal ABC transporter ATP-binding protein [Neisseriaceae bacterium]|nr:metal ABC transporter ATP-binding protein [Neisseriaceae bacterium]
MPICAENITVSYSHFPAVHHVSITFNEGESWAVCGPNGAGKSTLLKALMGLEKCDTGHIHLQGLSRNDITYLPQLSEIDRSQPMSVFELAMSGLWYEIGSFGGINNEQKQRIFNALSRVGMQQDANRLISQLSNGQFQRVLFARMLVQKAKFLLLDEPFNAIDEQTTNALLNILTVCRKDGQGVIAVLHDDRQVRNFFSHTLLMAREKVAAGKTEEVLTRENLQRASLFRQDTFTEQWCIQTAENQ